MAAPGNSIPIGSAQPAPARQVALSEGRRPARVRWFELRQEIPRWAQQGLALSGFLTIFAAWAWVSHQSFVNPVFVPTPERVWDSVQSVVRESYFWTDVRVSLLRVTAGFLLSAAIAVPVGILLGAFKPLESFFQPVNEFIRYVPVPALVPLVMLCFGIGETAKIVLIFIGTFFQLVLMVADEIRRVGFELLQVSYTLGATRREVLLRVIWPAAKPGIFDALRLCNGWAWTYLIVAELIAANEGLGFRILKFSRFLQTPKIFFYILVLGLIGLALDLAFRKMNARLFHWADTTKR
jgi:NitT/TauT family transport system permease protein